MLISGVLSGQRTVQRIPALEAYAAKADPAFPLVGIERCLIPSSLAIETAIPSPLALNDPVGSLDSSLMKTDSASNPKIVERFSSLIKGVITSPRETMFSSDVTGRSGEYLQKPGFFESSIELLVISLDSLSKSYFTTIGFPIVDIVWKIQRSNHSHEYAHSR